MKLLRLWKVPPDLPDDFQRITAWVAVLTGLDLDGNTRPVQDWTWLEQRRRLEALGGPPMTDRDESLDPILYGADPLARAHAWIERKRWAEAEDAFGDVLKAWPEVARFWIECGRFFRDRARPKEAGDAFAGIRPGRPRPEILKRNPGRCSDLQSGPRSLAWTRNITLAVPR